jgi:sugar lactone lactonase YvrE
MTLEVAIPSRAILGEGPRWDAASRRLLWVDVEAGELHIGAERTLPLGARVGTAAPTTDPDRVLVALADRLAVVSLADGALETLAPIPHGRDLRLNDGGVDPAGRFWVGSMALDERPGAAALYRFDDAGLTQVLDGVSLSNGLGWSPDGRRMYYVDSLTHRIDLFDFDAAAGAISDRRPFVEIEPEDGFPDGLAIDDEEGVWVALFRGHSVRRYGPDGSLDRVLELPVAKVTACAFGGDDGRTLYVTTASIGGEPEPAGSVFAGELDVAGPPARPVHLGEGRSTAPSDAEDTSAR